jgi:hypothetical protein
MRSTLINTNVWNTTSIQFKLETIETNERNVLYI